MRKIFFISLIGLALGCAGEVAQDSISQIEKEKAIEISCSNSYV
jgi:hypothetical protein